MSWKTQEVRLAGALGFEPRNDGIKTRCLTTWRRPNFLHPRIRARICVLDLFHAGFNIERMAHSALLAGRPGSQKHRACWRASVATWRWKAESDSRAARSAFRLLKFPWRCARRPPPSPQGHHFAADQHALRLIYRECLCSTVVCAPSPGGAKPQHPKLCVTRPPCLCSSRLYSGYGGLDRASPQAQ